jgi:hypothetical protein
MIPRQAIPSTWADRLTDGPIALGYDIATTERGTSNPSALNVQQRDGRRVLTRLIVSWKTRDPAVARQVLKAVLDDIEERRMKPRRLVIDASNEKYYAADVRTLLAGRVAVELVGGNQKIEFRGESLDAKTLLGNMYVSAIEDGFLLLPAGDWIMLDHRLVMREGGGFVTNLGPNGEHGDTFDGGKLAYWGLNSSGGPVKADAIQVGSFGGGVDTKRPVFTDPWMDGIARQNLESQGGYLA